MSIRTYIVGFTLSVALTLVAFWLVWNYLTGSELFAPTTIVALLVGLAVMQLYTQLICFLHLGAEKKPRWNLITLLFAAFTTIVVIGGTIWIMYHLDHEAMEKRFNETYPGGVLSPQTQDD